MADKISKTARIEAGNLMEEAKDVFDSCVECGLCRSRCGVFRVLREEQYCGRGRGEMLSKKIMDKILFECNLCRACEESCPTEVKVCEAVLKGRSAMVLLGRGLKENENMVKRIRRSGNPFGEKGGNDEKLYCC